MSDGTAYPVEGVAADDPDVDLALLKVNAQRLPKLELGSSDLPAVGTRVFAIGSPSATDRDNQWQFQFKNTLSDGLISAHREPIPQITKIETLQISAPVSHGSSGGPLLTSDCKVVGVVSFGFLHDEAENINGAVPVSFVNKLIERRGTLKPFATGGGHPLEPDVAKSFGAVLDAIKDKKYADALGKLAKLRDRLGDWAGYWFVTGYVHMLLGNYDLAREDYTIAAKLNPTFAPNYVGLGSVCYLTQRYDDAVSAYKSAAVLDPSCALTYLALGTAYCAQGRFDDAVNAFKTARSIDPESPVDSGLGMAYAGRREFSLAIESLKSAIAKQPKSGECYSALGGAYTQAGEQNLAIDAFKTAIKLNNSDCVAHLGLGFIYFAKDAYDDAEREFNAVLANQSGALDFQVQARLYLGECEWQKWHLASAIAHWRKVGQLDPQQQMANGCAKSAKKMLDMIDAQQADGVSLHDIRASFSMNRR